MPAPTLPRLFATLLALFALSSAARAAEVLAAADSAKEANEIVVLLDRFGVSGATTQTIREGRVSRYEVHVEPTKLRAARYVLENLGLPREDRGGLSSLLDAGGVIPSKLSERGKLMHAIADKLSRTLESNDGVLTARVHIVVPTERMLADSSSDELGARPSASVYLRWLPAWHPEMDKPVEGDDRKGDEPGSPNGLVGDEEKFLEAVCEALAKDDFAALAGIESLQALSPKQKSDWLEERSQTVLPLMLGTTPPGAPIERAEVVATVANAVEALSVLDVRVVYEKVDMQPARVENGELVATDPVIKQMLLVGKSDEPKGLDSRLLAAGGLLVAAAIVAFVLKFNARRRAEA
jgi:type III secretory pathway lipoprotein EscJ